MPTHVPTVSGPLQSRLSRTQKKKPPICHGGFFRSSKPYGDVSLKLGRNACELAVERAADRIDVAIITTEMPAAMSPYSIAVAPDSSFKNARTRDITNSLWLFLRSQRNARIIKKLCGDAAWTLGALSGFSRRPKQVGQGFYGGDLEIYDTDICNGSTADICIAIVHVRFSEKVGS
jgi:hypothetical protein